MDPYCKLQGNTSILANVNVCQLRYVYSNKFSQYAFNIKWVEQITERNTMYSLALNFQSLN